MVDKKLGCRACPQVEPDLPKSPQDIRQTKGSSASFIITVKLC